jgi:hypothetical protein
MPNLGKLYQIRRTVTFICKNKPKTPISARLPGEPTGSLVLPTPKFRPIRRYLAPDLAVGGANDWRCSNNQGSLPNTITTPIELSVHAVSVHVISHMSIRFYHNHHILPKEPYRPFHCQELHDANRGNLLHIVCMRNHPWCHLISGQFLPRSCSTLHLPHETVVQMVAGSLEPT